MTLDWLITDKTIALHRDRKGHPIRMPVSDGILRLIDQRVSSGDTTLETGAGLSTVAFVAKGAKHTAICPDKSLGQRIRDFCEGKAIDHAGLSYHAVFSQDILHSISGEYSFALIDGSHSFPDVFVDFFYINSLLGVNGVIVVDDTWIWTSEVLSKYLASEPEWRVVHQDIKSAAFQKITQTEKYKDFDRQKFVIMNSTQLYFNRLE